MNKVNQISRKGVVREPEPAGTEIDRKSPPKSNGMTPDRPKPEERQGDPIAD